MNVFFNPFMHNSTYVPLTLKFIINSIILITLFSILTQFHIKTHFHLLELNSKIHIKLTCFKIPKNNIYVFPPIFHRKLHFTFSAPSMLNI